MNYKPEGHSSVTLNLILPDTLEGMKFYEKAFNAENKGIAMGPDGKTVLHAVMNIENTPIILADANPDFDMYSPLDLGGNSFFITLYVEDAEKTYKQAIEAGCEEIMPLEDMFWGEKMGNVKDPYGYIWSISQVTEKLSFEEIKNRAKTIFKENPEFLDNYKSNSK